MQKLFAFWKYGYNSYTGINGFLGAELIEIKENGRATVAGFEGYTVTPAKILPLKAGKEIKAKLEALQNEYREAHKAVDREFQAKVHAIMDPPK